MIVKFQCFQLVRKVTFDGDLGHVLILIARSSIIGITRAAKLNSVTPQFHLQRRVVLSVCVLTALWHSLSFHANMFKGTSLSLVE
jgi:hypothetical protein